jgi:hypothetical protein
MGLSNYLPSSRLIQPGVCTSSTRPASPFEGQCIFETDTDKLLVWNGSAWVIPNQKTTNPEGFEFIGSVSNTSTIVSLDSVFTSTYENYRIIVNQTNVTLTGTTLFRFRANGTAIASNDYYYGGRVYRYNAADEYWAAGPTTSGFVTMIASGNVQTSSYIDLSFPRSANRKSFVASSTSNFSNYIGTTTHGILNLTASNYDGFQFSQDAGGTLTLTATVYGYRGTL